MGSVVGAELVRETGPDYVFSFFFSSPTSNSRNLLSFALFLKQPDVAQIVNLRSCAKWITQVNNLRYIA